MQKQSFALTQFHVIRPQFESTQAHAFDWLIKAHVKAECVKRGSCFTEEEQKVFEEELTKRFFKVGCKPDTIHKRGHVVEDFLHMDWSKMKIYPLDTSPTGVKLQDRSHLFKEVTDDLFDRFYQEIVSPPAHIVHVSCTGYTSPSAGQSLVSKRGWNATVTHAYHMGCYGAIPAIRMGMGFIQDHEERSDIVHTEISSLHNNPLLQEADQLIAQSLFADGFIKYSVITEDRAKKSSLPFLKVVATHEEIVPNSLSAMTWNTNDWGFQLTLSKEIPILIARSLQPYLETLSKKAGFSLSYLLENSQFAIHPGGPKILQYIEKLLGITSRQLELSYDALRDYGNMSSAMLPHIWSRALTESRFAKGTPIISLAFGPGLTVAGALLEVGAS